MKYNVFKYNVCANVNKWNAIKSNTMCLRMWTMKKWNVTYVLKWSVRANVNKWNIMFSNAMCFCKCEQMKCNVLQNLGSHAKCLEGAEWNGHLHSVLVITLIDDVILTVSNLTF